MSTQASTAAEFDRYAATYEQALNQGLSATGEQSDYFAQGRLAYLARRLERAGCRATRILDYGCGNGAAAETIRQQFSDLALLAGVDLSSESVSEARRRHGGLAEFSTLGQRQPRADFDVVYCNGVFHHIPPAERAGAARYIADSLCPGGWLALFENNPLNPGTRWVMSRIPFDRDAILVWPQQARTLFRAAGLNVIETSFHFFFPRVLAAFRPAESLLTRVPLGGQYLVLAQKPQCPPNGTCGPAPVIPSPHSL